MLSHDSTTGLPKGVELSHYNVISNSMQLVHKRSIISDTLQGKARKARIDLSGERWLAPLPMYHAYVRSYRLHIRFFALTNHPGSNILLYERGPNRSQSLYNAQVQH